MAQSNATTAIAARRQIEQLVAEGRSAAQIDQVLVSEYGQTILLLPPDTGGIPIIWVIPLVLGAGALAAVGVVFWRRSRAFAALTPTETSRSGGAHVGGPSGEGDSERSEEPVS